MGGFFIWWYAQGVENPEGSVSFANDSFSWPRVNEGWAILIANYPSAYLKHPTPLELLIKKTLWVVFFYK